MILKIYFEEQGSLIPFQHQDVLNGVFYKTLLKGNPEFHNGFSDYAVSSIQNCHQVNDGLMPYSGKKPYIQVASKNEHLIVELLTSLGNLIDSKTKVFFDRTITNFDLCDFEVSPYEYDIIHTISPVLIVENGQRYTFQNNEKWEDMLNENCRQKLKHAGIEDSSFKIVCDKNKLKAKSVLVSTAYNKCTNFVGKVYGKPKTREVLYNLGIGGSTGSGFGSVAIVIPK